MKQNDKLKNPFEKRELKNDSSLRAFQLRIPTPLWKELKYLTIEAESSLNEIVTYAIRELLKQYKEKNILNKQNDTKLNKELEENS